jgi:hypothetical protein
MWVKLSAASLNFLHAISRCSKDREFLFSVLNEGTETRDFVIRFGQT